MNAATTPDPRSMSRGPCGDVNYVTDVALEQEVLVGTLIDLARALADGGEEALPNMSIVLIGGLFIAGIPELATPSEIRLMTQHVMRALMPRGGSRVRPPFDMRRLWNAEPDLAALKTLLLLGLCGLAANAVRTDGAAYRDRAVNRHFVDALTTLAETDTPARLLPLARETGRLNFRCLDVVGRRRRSRPATTAPQLTCPCRPDGRMELRDEAEAEDALLALSTHAGLRALRKQSARTAVSLSWYGPASVCMLFTLLSLGIRDIQLGPDRPTFIPPAVSTRLEGYFNLDSALFTDNGSEP